MDGHTRKRRGKVKVTLSLPRDVESLLRRTSQETGIPMSRLAADALRASPTLQANAVHPAAA